MQKAPPTPKGFRDIKPAYAKKRREVINPIAEILEAQGFVPLETPTVEFADTLTGKYGDEERLIYKFTDRGGRDLALRYDLTVPLARFVASNQNLLSPTFSRYQIGQVFRGENPQHGRYREFTQFDFDTVGSDSVKDDAKIIFSALAAAKKLGFEEPIMLLNDREAFKGFKKDFIIALDKFYKIGMEGVKEELRTKNYPDKEIDDMISRHTGGTQTANLLELLHFLDDICKNPDNEMYELSAQKNVIYDPYLARGLNYYTGAIFELKTSDKHDSLSIGGGGRYDNLIGMFVDPDKGRAGKQIPAVGFSFGLDRIVDLLLNE